MAIVQRYSSNLQARGRRQCNLPIKRIACSSLSIFGFPSILGNGYWTFYYTNQHRKIDVTAT